MKQIIIRNVLFVLIICIIFVIVSFLIIRRYLSCKLNKRVKPYKVVPKREETVSIIDHLISIYLSMAVKLSAFFNQHHLFTKYSQKFDKYLTYIVKDSYESMDYVSSKFIITIIINLLYFIVLGVRSIHFNIWHFLIINIVSFYALDAILIILYKSKQKIIEEQLLQAIIIMNGAFKSGKNIYQAVQIIKNELPNPIKEEFGIIAKDLDYGLDINVIFERFYERVKVEEARYITSSLSLLNKTGGSVVTVFNMIEKRFYNRLKIRNELKSLTATSKLLKNFLCFIPFAFVLFIMILDRSYFKVFFTSMPGIVVFGMIIFLYLTYVIIIRRIMKVDEV